MPQYILQTKELCKEFAHTAAVNRVSMNIQQGDIYGLSLIHISEADPVVEIRSAVHSNYANMVAMLSADNKVYLGREERYSFTPGQPGSYDNRDGSLCFVSDMPEMYYFLYGEGWSHSQEEMLNRGLTMDQYMDCLLYTSPSVCYRPAPPL